ncbi:MAG: sensor domain-containing protein [Burkholderiales bacterium]
MQAILDNAPFGIWLLGIDGRYRFINKTFCDSVGLCESHALAAKHQVEALGPTLAESCIKSDLECLNRDSPHISYETLPFVDGKPHVLEIVKVKVRDAQGAVTGIIGIASDITARRQAEEELLRFKNILDNTLDMIFMFEPDTLHFVYLNHGVIRGLGYSRESLLTMTPCQILPQFPTSEFYQLILPLLSGEQETLHFETVYRRSDLTEFEVDIFLQLVEESSGKKLFVAMARDITERKKAEEAQQLAAMVFQHSSEPMSVVDSAGNIVWINAAFTELTGYSWEEAVGKKTSLLSSGRHNRAFYATIWNALNATGHWQGEIWNRRKSGEAYLEWLTINAICNEDGSVYRYVALLSDITKKREAEDLIWQQTNFDTLTRLPNRHMFQDRLDLEIKKTDRVSLPMALLFIDLDNFKEINDALGHSMGDLLLIEAARRIKLCVRESDTTARLGGDEFGIIISELKGLNRVEHIIQNLLAKLSAPILLGEEKAYISASIGITVYPDDASDANTLLKNADQAMYAAKAQGRNCFRYFTFDMQESAKTRRRLINDLRNALVNKQFCVLYQPIVSLAENAIFKAEALIRWRHPQRGMVSPADFIPLLEETGMIIDIGDWVFRQTARQAAIWRAAYHQEFQISVNVSPVQFRRYPGNFQAWFEFLKDLNLDGNSIVVEITEGLLLDASTAIIHQLRALRNAGICISLDDFGTGYSSLSYLKKFDIDFLKIDQTFVRELETSPNDMALCEAIIVMAHKLGLKVVAEGIETEAQRNLLLAAGCDYGQGYFFSRPVPPAEFELLLKR